MANTGTDIRVIYPLLDLIPMAMLSMSASLCTLNRHRFESANREGEQSEAETELME